MKTETDKEIVASNEAPRKIKFKADESSARKDGIEEKYDREKRGTKGRRKKRYTGVKTYVRKKVKKVHTCNSINTSVGVLNRVTIWRTMDSGRDLIKETTRVC